MTYMLTRIQVDDYDAWKPVFDSDPAGARKNAKGHRVLRGVENPSEIFVQVVFATTQEAESAREQLLASGVLDRVNVQAGPTIASEAETVDYE